jgi:hypothetical protein
MVRYGLVSVAMVRCHASADWVASAAYVLANMPSKPLGEQSPRPAKHYPCLRDCGGTGHATIACSLTDVPRVHYCKGRLTSSQDTRNQHKEPNSVRVFNLPTCLPGFPSQRNQHKEPNPVRVFNLPSCLPGLPSQRNQLKEPNSRKLDTQTQRHI